MDSRIKNFLLGSLPFLVIIIVWQIFYNFEIFPQWLIPTPAQTAKTFLQLTIDGSFLKLVLLSAYNAVPAYIFAFISALVLGIVIGLSDTAKKVFYPFLSAIYPIPSLAWLPLIIIIFGFTRQTIWIIIFVSSFTKMIYSIIDGVRGVKLSWILAAKNFGLTRSEIIFKVIIPASLPQIITGMKLGFGSSWRSLVGAEMLVVTLGGLGKFIWTAQWFFSFDKVLSGIVMIAIIGILVESLVFKKLENFTIVRWGFVRNED